jgi:hypothetical protein
VIKGRRKQLGILTIELVEAFPGNGLIADTPLIVVLGYRESQGSVAFFGLMRYSRHGSLQGREVGSDRTWLYHLANGDRFQDHFCISTESVTIRKIKLKDH